MFKKTLLATALVAATFGASAVTTVGPASVDISSQGVPLTKAYTLPSVVVTINAADVSALTSGAKIKLTFSGAFVASAPAAPVYTDTGGDTTTDGTLAAPTVTSTTVTSQFTVDPAGGTIAGDTVTFSNIPLLLSSAAVGTEVKVTASITSSTDVVSTSTTSLSTKVAKVVNQWSAGIVDDITSLTPAPKKLDAQIDVGDSRESFVGGATTDTLTFDANEVTSVVSATETGLTLKLLGDFTGVKSVTSKTAADAAVTWTINSAKTEATYTFNATTTTTVSDALDNPTVVTVALNTAAADLVSLEVRGWEMDADVAYTDSESQVGAIELLSEANAGAWTLNGVTDTTNYVPFGPNTALIYQATSTFNEDAMLSVSYLNETTGKMVALNDIGTVKANSVTKLGKVISDAIIADSGMTSGKTKMTVTVNAPTGKVTFFKGFKDTSDKDRLGL